MKKLTFAILVLSQFGCNSGPKGSSGEAASTVLSTDYKGDWQTDCFINDSLPVRWETHIDGTTRTDVGAEYYDSANPGVCSKLGARIESIGIYKDMGASLSIPGGQLLEVTYSSKKITLILPEAVTAYNTNAGCGFSDWALNVPKVIPSGNACADSTPHFLDVIKAAGDDLLFSQINYTNPMTAPTEINHLIYRKVSAPPPAATILSGAFLSPCYSDAQMMKYRWFGSNLEITNSHFSDPANPADMSCTKIDTKGVYTYDFVDLGASPDVGGARIIEGLMKTAVVTPLTAASAQSKNTAAYCGFNDWAVGVAKNVPVTAACLPAHNWRDIYKIMDGVMYEGGTWSFSSPMIPSRALAQTVFAPQ